jgi:lipopolysaccharide/colanic/teichoic acid biosynthesis glycosyltransferase
MGMTNSMRFPARKSDASRLQSWGLGLADCLAGALAPLLALELSRDPAAPSSVAFVAVGTVLAAFYTWRRHRSSPSGTWRVRQPVDSLTLLQASAVTAGLSYLALFTVAEPLPSAGVFVAQGLFLFALWNAVRALTWVFAQSGRAYEHVLVVGASEAGLALAHYLETGSGGRVSVTGFVDAEPSDLQARKSHILGTISDLSRVCERLRLHGIEIKRVIVSSYFEPHLMRELERSCSAQSIELQSMAIEPARSVNSEHAASRAAPFWKRCMDAVLSAAALIVLAPLLLIISAMVWFELGAPVLFWQKRVGFRGQLFPLLKFRTLRFPYDEAGRELSAAERISSFGNLLRKTHLDELPQLINVLAGDMSLVGPRPLLSDCQPQNANVRLQARPGLTGLAQVSGGQTLSLDEKNRLDELYVSNVSLWLDVRLILETVRVLAFGGGFRDDWKCDASLTGGVVATAGSGDHTTDVR